MEFENKEAHGQDVGIYEIVNLKTSTRYIGQTRNAFLARYMSHCTALRCNKHPNHLLQEAWNRDGAHSFAFRVVQTIRPGSFSSVFNFWEGRAIIEAMRDGEVYNLQIPEYHCMYSFAYYFGDKVVGMYTQSHKSPLDIAMELDIPFGKVIEILNDF